MDKSDLFEFRVSPGGNFRLAQAGKRVGANHDYIHVARAIDSYEVIVVHRGILYMREGRKKYTLEPGDMILLEPGKEHGGYQEHSVSFFWLHFTADKPRLRKRSYLRILKKGSILQDTRGRLCIPKCLRLKDPGRIYTAITEYLDACRSDTIYKYERMLNKFREIVFILMDDLARQGGLDRQARDAQLHHVWNIMHYINEYYSDRLTIAGIAEKIRLNQDYANRIFKTANGCSIQEYLIQKRIEAARDLIENAALTIAEVAARVGYDDPYYFSRIFKKKARVSPQQYREIIYKTRNK